jgi:hypothetical protein
MNAAADLMDRAKEFVRMLCARNLIPGADLPRLTVAIHDELCGSALATLAEIALRKDHVCRGNIEISIRAVGHDLLEHLVRRENLREAEMESDPVIRGRPVPPGKILQHFLAEVGVEPTPP